MEDQLLKIYTDAKNSGSYSSVEKLFQAAHQVGLQINRDDVRKFLSGIESYSLLKPKRFRFKRNRIYVDHINQLHMADLADMHKLAHSNKGTKFLLVVIDAFSKFLWVMPVRSKNAQDMRKAFVELYGANEHNRPKLLQTDAGMEFHADLVKSFLKSIGVQLFTTHSFVKASMAERVIRTLKSKIYKYLLHNSVKGNYKYLSALPSLVESYNNSIHRSIKMAPSQVTPENSDIVLKNLYPEYWQVPCFKKVRKEELIPGVSVRIAAERATFHKGYKEGWTDETYIIAAKLNRQPPVFRLKNLKGKLEKGVFYRAQLQKVKPPLIEKIIKRREKKRGETEVQVKWKNQIKPTWIKESDLALFQQEETE